MDLLQRLLDDPGLLIGLSTTFLLLFATYYNFKCYSYWSSRGIKGPTPWPFVGTQIYYFFAKKIVLDVRWTEQYGPVYGLYEGYHPVLRILDPELLKFVYIKHFESMKDRGHHRIHGSSMRKWVFWAPGTQWSTSRALITPSFSSKKMKNAHNNMIEASASFSQLMDQRFAKFKMQGARVVIEDLMSLTMDVLSRSLFGLKINVYQGEKSEFNKQAFAFSDFNVPWQIMWSFIPRKICRILGLDSIPQSKYAYFEKLGQTVVTQRRLVKGAKQDDMIQALIDAKIPKKGHTMEAVENAIDQKDDLYSLHNAKIGQDQLKQTYEEQLEQVLFDSFSDAEIRAQMTFMFIAGYDTTSSSLSFCLFELAHNQDIQQEVAEEVKAAFGDGKIYYTTLLGLRKLDALINEALRLYGPVTQNERMVTAKGGIEIPTNPPIWLPENTMINSNWFVTHRMPQYWKDPLKFDITRFYPENRDQIISGSYGPFGLGPRNCAGMKFAIISMKTSITKILLKFKIKPGPKSAKYPPEFKQNSFFTQLQEFEIIAEPRN